MKIYVINEERIGESRVAITEDVAERFVKGGNEIIFGTDFNTDRIEESDLVVSVNPPPSDLVKRMKEKAISIAMQRPHLNRENLDLFCRGNITSFALDMIPRTTRAQYMDVLSSQSGLTGYRAVIEAAALLKRSFPMMITTAGTVQAARVLIIGAGVAGLQAIATAKRLGAIVYAFDVRAAAKEQVESLGARFVNIDGGQQVGGVYAREISMEEQARQEHKMKMLIPSQDIIIASAQIPFKKAPVIVKRDMVGLMREDSVIIDLASESGGNCEITKHGETVVHSGVRVVSFKNILNNIHYDASRLFAKNVYAFVELLSQKLKETHDISETTDEIIKGTLLTHNKSIIMEIPNVVRI